MLLQLTLFFFFFFNDTATTEIYTLSLHDALPISIHACNCANDLNLGTGFSCHSCMRGLRRCLPRKIRSEEHTSELQSQSNLVCRLLLEKKNHTRTRPTPVCSCITPNH